MTKTEASEKLNTPRMSTPTLELRNRYFAVTDGNLFSYYPIVYDHTAGKPIIRFIKTPPILLEGYAIIEKKIYRVTSEDILRKVIRLSREVTLESINGTSTNSNAVYDTDNGESGEQQPYVNNTLDAATATLVRKVVQQHNEQFATLGSTLVEVGSSPDVTWTNQVRALLGDSDEEESFEVGETWEIENLA